MPLTRRLLPAGLLLLAGACAVRVEPPFSRFPPPPSRLAVPPVDSNLIVNGSFEKVTGEEPAGWRIVGRGEAGGRVGSVEDSEAPDGKRVAEISVAPGEGVAAYGFALVQEVRVKPWTTYDLSVWVRGIDLTSAVDPPRGFGRQCGLFFSLLGPDNDPATRIFPSGAFPRRDGTTKWELRRMRFTTPPADAFPPPKNGDDGRFRLALEVVLEGTGTIQVDDLRLALSAAKPPPPRRGWGRLALVRQNGKPAFGFGIHTLPEGMGWREVAKEGIFNFTTGGGSYQEKVPLGILSFPAPWSLDPACRGCGAPTASECTYCLSCPDEIHECRGYDSAYLQHPGPLGIWLDEPNTSPELQGTLEDLVASARRIKEHVARRLPPGQGFYLLDTDSPAGVYYNTYGWEDLARYHASEAFDIAGSIRRGGNPKKGAVGGVMSEYQETSINGIRTVTRRLSDDVTSPGGRQWKPVWMIVNGGSGKIVTDPADRAYPTAPHDAAELFASRPDLPQLRYMLAAAVLNGATGLLFYQDDADTRLKPEDPFWKEVLIPAAAELSVLERETGFLGRAEYNGLEYRLSGSADQIDSMLKRCGEDWILAVANASPEAASGVEFVLEGGAKLEAPPARLAYRHDPLPARRRFDAVPLKAWGAEGFPLDLPGYGVALYRLRIRG